MANTQQTIFEIIQNKTDELDKKNNTVSWIFFYW